MATAKKTPKVKGKAASPAPPKQEKILRIGVIQAGKIIEERLIRKRENVTIGASPRNNIVVPASSLPRTFTLFELQAGSYSLKFGENMDGRVSVNNQVLSLDSVRTQGLAKPKGNMLALALNEESRGKVLLGEITLLFQFVTPPPIQPRPQLPPSIRGGFMATVDWVLASAFITLAVTHFGFLLYLRTMDFPRKIEADVIPDRFADFVPEVEKPKVLDLSKLAKLGEDKVEKAEKQAGPKKKSGGGKKRAAKPCDEACQAAKAERRRARLAKQVSSMGVLKLLGTKGRGSGATANLIGSGDPGTDVAKAFSGVGGLTVSGRGGGKGGLRGKGAGGTGKALDIGDLGGRVKGPAGVKTGKMVKERVPKAVVKSRQAEIDGTMNADATYRILRRGMRCVTASYQRALKRDPKLSGKVSACLTVNTMGRVGGVTIEEDTIGDGILTNSIKSCMRRLRFPPPEGGSAEVCVPIMLQSQQ